MHISHLVEKTPEILGDPSTQIPQAIGFVAYDGTLLIKHYIHHNLMVMDIFLCLMPLQIPLSLRVYGSISLPAPTKKADILCSIVRQDTVIHINWSKTLYPLPLQLLSTHTQSLRPNGILSC